MKFRGGSGSGSADPCLWLVDPDPAIFVIDFQDASKKLIFNTIFSACYRYFLKVHLHHFSKIKSQKEPQNSRNQGFSYYFCMMIEGSGSGSRAGSGSKPLTSGSGSGSKRSKNMWIRWIRIRIRIRNTLSNIKCFPPIFWTQEKYVSLTLFWKKLRKNWKGGRSSDITGGLGGTLLGYQLWMRRGMVVPR